MSRWLDREATDAAKRRYDRRRRRALAARRAGCLLPTILIGLVLPALVVGAALIGR
jgi:hypothetical protein